MPSTQRLAVGNGAVWLSIHSTARDNWEYQEPAKLAVVGFLWGGLVATWLMSAPANTAILMGSAVGTTVINRTGWKYQEWLAGFNGGALRAPAPRIPDRLMKQARAALVASGLPVTDLPDSEFVKGRTKA